MIPINEFYLNKDIKCPKDLENKRDYQNDSLFYFFPKSLEKNPPFCSVFSCL